MSLKSKSKIKLIKLNYFGIDKVNRYPLCFILPKNLVINNTKSGNAMLKKKCSFHKIISH